MKKTIPTCRLDEFNTRIEKLNKRLAKLNKSLLEVTELKRFIKKEKVQIHHSGESFRNDTFHDVLVEYVSIQIDGLEFFKKDDSDYEYIGTINVKDGVKTVYCANPLLYAPYLRHFQSNSDICDHCRTKRQRNTYHLFDNHETVLKIGSTCAKDFFGYDVDKILSIYYEIFMIIHDFEELDEEHCRNSFAYSCDEIYSRVMSFTKSCSYWESVEKTDLGFGTSTKIRNSLIEDKNFPILKMPLELLEKIRKYWEEQKNTSAFALNMWEAVRHDYAVNKNIGSYAYAIFGAIKGIKEKEDRKGGQECQYKDGERPELNLTVTHRHSFTIPGYSYHAHEETIYAVEFLSDDGVIYFVKSSSNSIASLNIGDKVKLTGTISGQDNFAGKKRWVLKRCKIKEVKEVIIKKTESNEDPIKALDLLYENI